MPTKKRTIRKIKVQLEVEVDPSSAEGFVIVPTKDETLLKGPMSVSISPGNQQCKNGVTLKPG